MPASAAENEDHSNAEAKISPHSWRVAILPFLGHAELYEKYRLNEPWDSDYNKTLLSDMPDVYRHPSEPADSTTTCYVGVVGEHSALGRTVGHPSSDFHDGTSNSLLILESRTSIPWTKPEDLLITAEYFGVELATKPPQISEFHPGVLLYVMADVGVRKMKPINNGVLSKILTIDGGERIR